jgi:WD40 repeat protein
LWDPFEGTQVKTLEGHEPVEKEQNERKYHVNHFGVVFLPDGRIASLGADETLRLWDPRTGTEQKRWSAPKCGVALAVSSTGRLLATGHDGVARVWRVPN